MIKGRVCQDRGFEMETLEGETIYLRVALKEGIIIMGFSASHYTVWSDMDL